MGSYMSPIIAEGIKPPQIENPFDLARKRAELQMIPYQMRAAQQESAQRQLQLQQAQQDFQDQQKMRQIFVDTMNNPGSKFEDIPEAAMKAGVGPRIVIPLQQQILERRLKLADIAKTEVETGQKTLENTAKRQSLLLNDLSAWRDKTSPEERMTEWENHVNDQHAKGYLSDQEFAQTPKLYPGDQQVDMEIAHLRGDTEMHKRVIEEAGLQKTKAETEEAGARTAQVKQATALLDEKIKATKDLQAPGAIENVILGVIPTSSDLFPQAVNAAKAAAAANPGEPAKVLEAIKPYTEKALELQTAGPIAAARVNAETPALVQRAQAEIPGQVSRAVQVAKAEAPIRVNTAVQTEIAKAKLAPGAVAEIQNPTLQMKVIGDYTKANDEYQAKVGDAQRLAQFVQAARSGNQAAAAMIPIAEVREIVNRVNSQELAAAGGGVSLARKVQNWASAATQGRPSDATLSDIDSLGKMLLGAADRTRRGKVQTLNTLGAKFPIDAPEVPGIAPVAPTSANPNPSGYVAGHRYGGLTYLGGDPTNRASWK